MPLRERRLFDSAPLSAALADAAAALQLLEAEARSVSLSLCLFLCWIVHQTTHTLLFCLQLLYLFWYLFWTFFINNSIQIEELGGAVREREAEHHATVRELEARHKELVHAFKALDARVNDIGNSAVQIGDRVRKLLVSIERVLFLCFFLSSSFNVAYFE